MIIKYDGHAAVANSALINQLPSAVLNATGFDPETGWFFHQSFYQAVNHITKSVSLFTVLKNMIAGSDYLARKGIGLVHTAEGVGFSLDLDVDIMRLASLGPSPAVSNLFPDPGCSKSHSAGKCPASAAVLPPRWTGVSDRKMRR